MKKAKVKELKQATEQLVQAKETDKSLYIIVASDSNKNETQLENSMILARTNICPDQLKFTYDSTNKYDQNGRLKLQIKQCLNYFAITTPTEYYWFTRKFIGMNNLDGCIPKKMNKFFYCFQNKQDAIKKAAELTDLQEKYYDSLLNNDKKYIKKVNILVKDYIDLSFKFIQQFIIPDLMRTLRSMQRQNEGSHHEEEKK